MKNYKKSKNNISSITPLETENVLNQEEEKPDFYTMEVAVERIEGGLIGTLRIEDDTNSPLFKKNDLVSMMHPARVQIKDFVLYKSHDNYFLRRIIKFKGDDIYVAGDHEKGFHIIKREDIVGKVVSRQRGLKRMSFSLTPKKKMYTFRKVNLSYLRLKNRIIDYQTEVNEESLELASLALEQSLPEFQNTTEIKYNIDLDSDLQSFLNPDQLVLELRRAGNEGTTDEDEEDLESEEAIDADETDEGVEVQYVDEDGNPIENIDEIDALDQSEVNESAEDENEPNEAINSEISNEDAIEDEEEVLEEKED